MIVWCCCHANDGIAQLDRADEEFVQATHYAEADFSNYFSALELLPANQLKVKAIKLLSYYEQAPATEGIIFALQRIGKFYEERKMQAEALQFLQLAYKKAKQTDSQLQIGVTLQQIALIYQNEAMLTESLKYIYQALEIFEARHLYAKALISNYEASIINYKTANFEGALHDFSQQKACLAKLPKDSITNELLFFMMSGWNTAGLSYGGLSRQKEGLKAYDSAYLLASQLNNVFWQGLINGNKGLLLIKMGKTEEALKMIKKDFEVSVQFKVYSSATVAACSLCDAWIEKGDLAKAKHYLDTAVILGKLESYDSHFVQAKLLETSSRFHYLSGSYRSAYEELKAYMGKKDSINYEEKLLSTSQVKAQYELKKKQNEVSLLLQENAIKNRQIDNQKWLIIASVTVIILGASFLIYFFFNYKRVKKQKEIIRLQRDEIESKNIALEAQSQLLQEQNQMVQGNVEELEERVQKRTADLQTLNQELDTFLYHASHDIRRPISTLLGLERVSRYSESSKDLKFLFESVVKTASEMDSMLAKLQMAYHVNRPIEDKSWIRPDWIIDQVEERYKDDLLADEIDFEYEQQPEVGGYFSNSLLRVVLLNLIENAIRFQKKMEKKGFIRVTTSQTKDVIVITVQDNGIGIQPQYLNRIFDMYFRGSEQSKGNGIGLYLVMKALKLMNGTIQVESEFEVGTIFTVTIPIDREGIRAIS
ncbi:MAG: HAMP domain-containing histidine kinase [Bacteroidetes bacterium]|nr:HAMP domain-containing histidine kinase [Bacteroidota bacterium]